MGVISLSRRAAPYDFGREGQRFGSCDIRAGLGADAPAIPPFNLGTRVASADCGLANSGRPADGRRSNSGTRFAKSCRGGQLSPAQRCCLAHVA